jgi:hypothetical protein
MGNISQSSKRSALKGFDVYFQHEKKMNKHIRESTAIQQLLEDLGCGESLTITESYLLELLDKEKKIIIDSFCEGYRAGDKPHRKFLANDFYNLDFGDFKYCILK